MRRLFWCCMTMAVATAVCAYALADFVTRNPDSNVTQWTVTAYRLGTDWNPAYQVGQLVAEGALTNAASQPPAEPAPVEATLTLETHEIPILSADFQNDCNSLPIEVLDLIQTQRLTLREDDDPCTASHEPTAPETVVATLEPCNFDQGDEAPTTMPPCADEEDIAPSTMPYVEDEESAQASKSLSELWQQLFQEDPEACDTECGKQEESEYPHEEDPSTCEEDPAHDHHYPGCHHSGTVCCPYTGKCYPTEPKPEAPPKKKKKKKTEPEASQRQPCVPQKPCGTEECPAHPEVDTMEFRPSDAHPGEFEPKPM